MLFIYINSVVDIILCNFQIKLMYFVLNKFIIDMYFYNVQVELDIYICVYLFIEYYKNIYVGVGVLRFCFI